MSSETRLEPGARAAAETEVNSGNTAATMGSGEIEVFATPAMVALMEAAAVRCVRQGLSPEETSVGTRMEVSHVAATPLGMRVRAEAVLQKVEGRRLFFQVTAFDEKEKIGEGAHERFIVQREKFLGKVRDKGRQEA